MNDRSSRTIAAPLRGHLWPFFLMVVIWVLILTFAWSKVSGWTSQPVAWFTKVALHAGVGDWTRAVTTAPGVVEVQTRLEVKVNDQIGELIVEAEPGHFAYGLPVLWSLLLAAAGCAGLRASVCVELFQRLALGMVLLWPFQVFSLYMDLVKKMATAVPGGAGALRIDQWQLEGIALGYQVGTLLMPTLAPILLWLWMDRRFVREQFFGAD